MHRLGDRHLIVSGIVGKIGFHLQSEERAVKGDNGDMDMPLVSIVISSYDRPAMLLTALRSAQAQSYANLEILVQDDSTMDDCERAIREVTDPRIRYTRNRPPLGTSVNLRAGYRKAQGKYFATLNDDDFYGPTYIETMVKHLEENGRYAMAFSDHWVIDDQAEIDEGMTRESASMFKRNLLQEGSVPDPLVSAVLDKSVPGMFALFRRSAMDLEDFPDEVSSGYDYWLGYLAVREGSPIYYSSERLTSYRVHGGSQTSTYDNPAEALRSYRYKEFMLDRFLNDPRLARVHPALRSRLAELRAGLAISQLRLGKRREAASNLLLSCRAQIRSRTVLGLLLCLAPLGITRKLLAR